MVFNGFLYYKDSGDYLEIERFIVRESQLAFQLTSTWGEHGQWSIDATASQAGNEYISKEITSHQGKREGLPCIIRFRIKSQTENEVSVEGAWSESGEIYEFEGNLEKIA